MTDQRQLLQETRTGLTWKPFDRSRVDDLDHLMTAVETADARRERHSRTELLELFDSPSYRPSEDIVLGYDARGEATACAWTYLPREAPPGLKAVALCGMVHPDARGHGMGRAVLAAEAAYGRAWYTGVARPEDSLRIGIFNELQVEDERRLAARFALEPMRYFAELDRPLTAADRTVGPGPEGILLRPWSELDMEAARSVRNASFRDHWGSTDVSSSQWDSVLGSATFRPGWSFGAIDATTGALGGIVMSSAYEQDWAVEGVKSGYVGLLGTVREQRGRGVASSLLACAHAAMRADGMEVVGLGVDMENPSGALRLYRALGYQGEPNQVLLARAA